MYVTVDTSEVHELADDIRRHADSTPERAALVVSKVSHDIGATAQANLVRNGSVDTGNLLNSMSVSADGLSGDVGPTAEYGDFVEQGTHGPYPIHDAFGWGITVMHPGNDPKPYLGPSYDAHLPDLERALGALGAQAVSRG